MARDDRVPIKTSLWRYIVAQVDHDHNDIRLIPRTAGFARTATDIQRVAGQESRWTRFVDVTDDLDLLGLAPGSEGGSIQSASLAESRRDWLLLDRKMFVRSEATPIGLTCADVVAREWGFLFTSISNAIASAHVEPACLRIGTRCSARAVSSAEPRVSTEKALVGGIRFAINTKMDFDEAADPTVVVSRIG